MTPLVHTMQNLAETSSLPLYQQLQRALREAIDKRLFGPEGDAGLCMERLGFLRDGSAVEFCRSCFRGDMVDCVAELTTA
jgi:GntR family transcriptional regulator